MDSDPDLEALEASMRRRKQLTRALFVGFALLPVFVIGYCVKRLVRDEPVREVTLSPDEVRSVREVRQAHARRLGTPVELVAPAAILEQLRTAQPGEARCRIELRARGSDLAAYEPPTFAMTQLSAAELAAATPGVPPPGTDDIEVIFVVAHRRDAFSNGQTFRPGEISGRAYVWQRSADAIVCAADITATSSSEVTVQQATIGGAPVASTGRDHFDILRADLDRQLERAIAAGMRVIE